MKDTGRNAPCRCGSGKKYKRCCADRTAKAKAVTGMPGTAPPRKMRSYEHGHWHDVR